MLYVCNVEEESAERGNAGARLVMARAIAEGAKAVVVSAKIESEIAMLGPADQQDYLAALGLTEPGLNRVIRAGYDLLGLITFSPSAPRRRGPGRSPRAPVRRKRRELSTPTSNVASSGPRPSLMMTM